MNIIQGLLTITILILLIIIVLRVKNKVKREVEVEYVAPSQHPIYPFIQYDIREVLPPSRRTYMRYPYYFHRYGIFSR